MCRSGPLRSELLLRLAWMIDADMTFHVADLDADEERQLVAVRLEFTGPGCVSG